MNSNPADKNKRILVQKWFDIGLRAKMSALVTVGLLGLLAIFGFIAITNVRQTTQQLLSEHVLRARILAESLDSSLSHVAGMLTVLSSQIDLDAPHASLDEWGKIFDQDFRPVQGVYILDTSNQLLAATQAAPEIKWDEVSLAEEQPLAEELEESADISGLPDRPRRPSLGSL